jgi:hypothetical protein
MPESPEGRVVHLSQGRLRVRIPQKRRDEAFFKMVEERLGGWQSVEHVETNPLTASVLVQFSDLGALFAENAMRNDLFTVNLDELRAEHDKPRQALTGWARQRWANADKLVRRLSDGNADLRSAAFLVAVMAAIVQAFRGQIAPPAATLLWDAGEMVRIWRTALDESSDSALEKASAEG